MVPHGLRSVGQEAQNPIPQCGAQAKGEELLREGLWDAGVEGIGEIQKEQAGGGVLAQWGVKDVYITFVVLS